jgi:hypothetical protein
MLMAAKKGLQDFDENVKKAGAAIGQLLGRFQSHLDKTGRQAIKTAKELVETASKTAEKTVGSTVERIHEATASGPEVKVAPAGLRPVNNKPISESVRLLAADINSYLTENGKTTVDDLLAVMEKRRRNRGMTFAAIGWLAGQDKVKITKDGKNISLA